VLLNGADPESAEVMLLSTGGIVIGTMPDMPFRSSTCRLGPFSMLFVFSDGDYEICRKEDGQMWTLEEWTDMLSGYGRKVGAADLDLITRQVMDVQGAEVFEDDFSLLQVEF